MNFKSFNLSESGLSLDSAISRPSITQGLDFDTGYEIQARRARISKLISVGGTATAAGTVSSAIAVVVTTTLTPTNINQGRNLAIPYLAIYEGTSAVGSMQVFPGPGSGIAADRWRIYSGFDYAAYNGTNSVYRVTMYNNSGTALPIYAITQWKYTQDNAGASS